VGAGAPAAGPVLRIRAGGPAEPGFGARYGRNLGLGHGGQAQPQVMGG
jgi:hypothetical protein